ncbi:hypothetical protein GJV85_04350 [Sulfurimonas aquatica]|uniref:Uncharacterized protein n=1 Tax=Sulfurimonas aquatica TaxID=2672570 RepID=A0A975AZD0_9BACT|nr:hypothetical protein [Sulfurimonas aquatica]QSZ41367.1 hypothetical protein GJV85_04350 [Sulfurimonas aquatica]
MKRIPYKKLQKYNRIRKNTYSKLLRKYSVRQWLTCIRQINIKMYNYEIYDQNSRLKYKPEFLTVNADMAIRVAKDNNNDFELPVPGQCDWLTSTEINLSDGPKSLIKLFGVGGISLMAVWQNRLLYNQSNMLARMHVLYKNYDSQVVSAIGISIKDIYVILLALSVVYQKKKKIYLKKDALIHPEIESLSKDKIIKFLAYFSRTSVQYKAEAKQEKIYENSFGKFKYLIRYPIIELEEDLYIVPVFEQLLDTLSNNLYFLLLEHFHNISKKSSKKFLDNFGNILEKYVLDLAGDVFEAKNIIRADDIVPNANELRCEVVAYDNNKALAIEVKKMNFKRDAIIDIDKIHIDDVLEKHLVKAFKQIENTLNYVDKEVQYGIIVVPDIMLSLSSMIDYMKVRFKGTAKFDDGIFICTLSWYEALMANKVDIVFDILNKAFEREFHEGNDIIMVMDDMKQKGYNIKTLNENLTNSTLDILKTIEKKY